MGAPAARADELSRHWARMGHEVTVLTGFPNHPTGGVPREWRERLSKFRYTELVSGVQVERTWLWPLPNRKAHERIRNYASFCLSAAISGLDLPKPEVVIGTSPQLLVALSGWWLAFWKRVPFVFEVRDLWPESLAAVGAGSEGSVLHRVLGAIAGFLYRRADHIVVVTPAFKDHLIRHWQVPAEKISIVENGVETDLFRSDPAADEVRKKNGSASGGALSDLLHRYDGDGPRTGNISSNGERASKQASQSSVLADRGGGGKTAHRQLIGRAGPYQYQVSWSTTTRKNSRFRFGGRHLSRHAEKS